MKCIVDSNIISYALRYGYDDETLNTVVKSIEDNLDKFTDDEIEMLERDFIEDNKKEYLRKLNFKTGRTRINILNRDFEVDEIILYYALRYSMGRLTYAPIIVIDNIKYNIAEGKISKKFIETALEFVKETSYSGFGIDKKTWIDFEKYLEGLV